MTATNKNIPSKRLKTWHRKYLILTEESERLSLKAFARMLTKQGNDNEQSTAKHWLGAAS
jgi:hypothetical protein